MARIDKMHFPVRAPAGTALTGLLGVVVNSGGSVVPSGAADAIGVVCLPGTISAGRPVSIIKEAEIVEFGGSAGTEYFAGSAGSISTLNTGVSVGHTIEGDRLVINL